VPPTGTYVVISDGLGVGAEMLRRLQQQGVTTLELAPAALADMAGVQAAIDRHRQHHGPITGLVHLAGLDPGDPAPTLAQWQQQTQRCTEALFCLLQQGTPDWQASQPVQPCRVLAASGFGGTWGRQPFSGPVAAGGITGLLKTFQAEWPTVCTKAVDLDLSQPFAALAQQLWDELCAPGGRVEVGYPAGQRHTFHTVAAPLAPNPAPRPLPSDAVVLVTGGAQGITAEIAKRLAQPGMTLVLVGRSPRPEPEGADTAGLDDVAQLRQQLVRRTLAAGDKPTPVQIERQIQRLLRNRTMVQNLADYERTGAAVEYHAVDVRSEAQFGGLIQTLYQRFGRIDGVIHGAGIIEDKLIQDKPLASFQRVFGTKIDSAFILGRYLQPASLKLLALFSSVAGRYGNRGQADYAAANETLNRLAWQWSRQFAQARVVALNWGPWDTTGMASDEVKRQFQERGVVPIPLDQGVQYCLDELVHGALDAVEVIAGEAPWESHEADQGQIQRELFPAEIPTQDSAEVPPEMPPEDAADTAEPFPLLWASPVLQPNSQMVMEQSFDFQQAPYLADHCLDGKGVLPAAGALECMAEFVQLAWPDWVVCEVRDLRVQRGIVIDPAQPRPVRFQARASSHADALGLQVAVEMVDPATGAGFYRAFVMLQPMVSALPAPPAPVVESEHRLEPQQAFHNYLFHGPRFQRLVALPVVERSTICAVVQPSPVAQWLPKGRNQSRDWLFDPGLIDTVPQLAMVWTRLYHDTSALPARFGRVARFGEGPLPERLDLVFRVTAADATSIAYSATFSDAQGQVRLECEAMESTCSAALNRLNRQWREANGLAVPSG